MKMLQDMTEPELKSLLNEICAQIVAVSERRETEKLYFALLLFNDPGIAQYVCNCDRGDVIKAMRETADRLEKRDTVERVEFTPAKPATTRYTDKHIDGLNIMRRYNIKEFGGEHDVWNVQVEGVSETDHAKILELGWRKGEDGWTYSVFV